MFLFESQPICSLWFWWVVVRIWRAVRLRSWAKFGRRREWSPRRRGCRRIWLPEGGKRLPDARAQCGTIRPSATGSAEWNWWMMKINLFYPIIEGIYIYSRFLLHTHLPPWSIWTWRRWARTDRHRVDRAGWSAGCRELSRTRGATSRSWNFQIDLLKIYFVSVFQMR